MKNLSLLKNKNLSDEICLLRIDLNIEDNDLKNWNKNHKYIPFRIKAVLPTIKFLIDKGTKVVILSHRGRPSKNSKSNPPAGGKNSKLTLKPFVKIISRLIKKPIRFIDFNNNPSLKNEIQKTPLGSIFLLENLRIFKGEEKNDINFAKKLASLGTFYVNDAFAVSHRENASVVAITKYLPSYAGFQFEKEIKNLKTAVKNPKKPLVIIAGGAKISDKLCLIKNFLKKPARQSLNGGGADYFLIGGGIANTFMAALKIPVGDSLYEKNMVLEAKKILRTASDKIFLPIDFIVSKNKILDIGPNTINFYNRIISSAKTIIWNGPMGKFEEKKFKNGTEKIAKAIRQLAEKNKKAKIIIGGGETIASLKSENFRSKPNIFLSTGGGAMFEYLGGKKLPGINALK